MNVTIYQADIHATQTLLHVWISRVTLPEGMEWLTQKQMQISTADTARSFFMAFSAVPRFVGKHSLELLPDDVAQAGQIRRGWHPAGWTADQAARIVLLLSLPYADADQHVRTLNQLASTADADEQTALYLSLPLLPHPEKHRARASEGIRTNMSVVFNAVALDNPYPSEYMDESAWNQLVLKSVFIGSPLHRIQGLDKRANQALANTLSDYAHERWAAGRPVTPELWRPVAPYLTPTILPDIEKLFTSENPSQQAAAALACAQSNLPEAKALLQTHLELVQKMESGELRWENVINLPA